MKKIAIFAAALVALAFSAPANAADIPAKGPYYKAAAPVFNWTGFYVGGHVGYGWAEDNTGVEADGVLGGVQLGYNWQLSRNWVFGIETDIAATDMTSAAGVSLDYIGTVRARVGYAADRTLFYVTGGYAYTELSTGLTGDGYALGAGIEYAFSRNWSAKVEYMFHNLDFGAAGDIDASTIKVGLNYRFGW
jgi:outer membrane immunogenic protein